MTIKIQELFSRTSLYVGLWNPCMAKSLRALIKWCTFSVMLWLKYQKYRGAFKEVLHEERILDEVRKREAIYTAKLNRQQKQVRRSAVHVVKYFNNNPLFQFLIHKELIEQKSTGRKAENEILDIGDSLGTKMVNLFLSHTDVSLITLWGNHFTFYVISLHYKRNVILYLLIFVWCSK